MSTNSNLNLSLVNQGGATNQSANANSSSLASSLTLQVAEFKSQTFGSLLNAAFNAESGTDVTGLGANTAASSASDLLASLTNSTASAGLSATGRNASLFDPESAYSMMTEINKRDVTYKAQFSELSQMKSYLAEMQSDGESLGRIDTTTSNESIKSQLQTFANQYNDWTRRFDADMQNGGVLAGTQAADVSRYELDQSVESRFNGATDGLHGLSDLGFTIAPNTKLASLDTAKLDAVLASNKQGVVNTIQEFSANFAKSAEMLNSAGNFIPNQLGNLDRAIHYIDDNTPALQAEFGLGDKAKPTGQYAQALAAYNQTYGK